VDISLSKPEGSFVVGANVRNSISIETDLHLGRTARQLLDPEPPLGETASSNPESNGSENQDTQEGDDHSR
jgi:hypothetical protein